MKPTVFIPEDRRRVMMLVEMDGITSDQQQELYNAALNPFADLDTLKRLTSIYEKQGARFRYTKADVDSILGERKPFGNRLARWLFG